MEGLIIEKIDKRRVYIRKFMKKKILEKNIEMTSWEKMEVWIKGCEDERMDKRM